MTPRTVPPNQRCVFCADRWEIAIGGQRMCRKHEAIVAEIARDAGVPVHLTIHRLTRDETAPSSKTLGRQLVCGLLPGGSACWLFEGHDGPCDTDRERARRARAGPETVGDLMPAAVAEILANQKLPPRSTPAVPAPSSRER